MKKNIVLFLSLPAFFLTACSPQIATPEDVPYSCQCPDPSNPNPYYAERRIEYCPSMWPRLPQQNITQKAPNLYVASLSTMELHMAEMERLDWCWAACVQMVLDYRGDFRTQKQIINETLGEDEPRENDAGDIIDMMKALSGPWRNVYVSNGDIMSMIRDLSYDWPVIVGLEPQREGDVGHAVILRDIVLSWCGNVPVIHKVRLYDPWPGKGEVIMDGETFKNSIDFSLHLYGR